MERLVNRQQKKKGRERYFSSVQFNLEKGMKRERKKNSCRRRPSLAVKMDGGADEEGRVRKKILFLESVWGKKQRKRLNSKLCLKWMKWDTT